MVEIVISIASKVAEYLVAPVGRQLGYLFHYNSNMAELRDQVEKMDAARGRLQRAVEETEMQGNGIEDDVQKWLTSANSICREAQEFIEDEKKAKKSCFKGLCPNLISRYQLSRHAKKKTQDVEKSRGEGNFQTISYRLPLPGAGSAPLQGYQAFESRASTLDKGMAALRDHKIKMIGVWGMGGVGKTTLVKQVAKLAENGKLFDKVVMVPVSREPNLENIQAVIADFLALKIEEKSELGIANRQIEILKKKKLLIILDDIWARLDLEAVGIPFGDDHAECKIVVTSRSIEVLYDQGMGTEPKFEIRILSDDEAWQLFQKTAGDCIPEFNLQSVARKVAEKCGGLPIALVTVAKALINKRLPRWEDALRQLTTLVKTDIRGMDENVYKSLKLSYDSLEIEDAKSLFLLCGLMGYGDISLDDLFKYSLGLGLFQSIKTLDESTNRLYALVDSLKASSLLLDIDKEYVKMHDVVRDVARQLVSEDPRRFVLIEATQLGIHESTRYIPLSLNHEGTLDLGERLDRPKIEFFRLHNEGPLKIPDPLFNGMGNLKVLHLFQMEFSSLPLSLQSLATLRTLCLDCCTLGDVAGIGELTKLEVLSFRGSDIVQLPREIAQLTCLRWLDLSDCHQLEVIPPNILSNLSQLEHQCMKPSIFTLSEDEESNQESYACLDELKHLSPLTTLNIALQDLKLLPKDMVFEKLTRYKIFIGSKWYLDSRCETKRELKLSDVNRSLHLVDGIGKLLKKTEELSLQELSGTKSVFNELDKEDFLQLKHLHVSSSPAIQCIVDSKYPRVQEHVLFPLLESLLLDGLINLEKVCHGPIPTGSFGNLKTLKVSECHGLKIFLSLTMATGFLHLQKIKIIDCDVIQQIIAYERESEIIDGHGGTTLQLFPKLRSLKLWQLPKLMNFSSKLETTSSMSLTSNVRSEGNWDIHMSFFSHQVSFPNLEKLKLNDLPKLKEIWHHQLSLGSFYNLRILKVYNCPGLLNLIPSYLIHNLNHLKDIDVDSCEVLKYVFDLQGLDGNIGLLPNLKSLWLWRLPKLRCTLCNKDEDKNDSVRCLFPLSTYKVFHNLKLLSIGDCSSEVQDEEHVNTLAEDVVLFNGKVLFPNLEVLILCNLSKLKEIWHHQLSLDSFSNLQILEVTRCPRLLNPIPCHLIQSFKNLKEIQVSKCEVLKHVFDFQGLDKNVEILPNLETLKLKGLHRLKSIICNKDKNDSMRCLFSPPMLMDFQNLKHLSINDCAKEDEDEGHVNTPTQDIMLFGEKVLFSNLEKLKLKGLPKLKEIWHHQLQHQLRLEFFYNLQILTVDNCPCLVNLVPSYLIQSFGNLKKINVQDCRVLEHVFDLQRLNGDVEILPKLEILNLRAIPRLRHIICNEDMRCLFFPSTSNDFQSLREVHVIDCKIQDKTHVNTSTNDAVLFNEKPSFLDGDSPMEHLPPEEAWSLFKKTAGDSVEENLQLRPIAIQVVEECEGLPIAVVTIAKALKDESVAVWKNALEQLRSCAVGKKVYSCLEWSYAHLKGDDVKSLFLLCGMLGYGDISLDHLLQYGMGLDLFDRIDSLEQARNRLLALVEILKASGLLLDSHEDTHNFDEERDSSLLFKDADNKFVRMHDVVYAVAREIASKDPHPFVVREDVGLEEWSETDESKRCTFISLNCKAVPELPHGLVCPELQFFLLHNNNPFLNIPNTFFQGMKNLKVLDLFKMPFTTLPSSLDSLANLRTLRLHRCKCLVDIALIGKLTKLEVLSLAGSTIQQLPNEMVQLTNLRLLDLNNCRELEVIPRNILSSLSRLECLYMNSSFTRWAVEGESNACLSELNHLSHLTTLDIQIPNANLLPKDILFENLTRYAIFMGDWRESERVCKTKRTSKLEGVNISLHLGDGINKLLERSEELEFEHLSGTKYVLHPSGRESFLELKHLRVSSSPGIQYIIDSKDLQFPLHNLEEVWHGPIPTGPFGNLKTLHVSICDGLKFLLLPSTARGLSQLEEMEIEFCDAMQSIIAYERASEIKEDGHVGTNLQLFPKLRSLKLYSLPQLINFSSELETTTSTSLSTNARSEGLLFNHLRVSGSPEIQYIIDSKDLRFPQHGAFPLHNLEEVWHDPIPTAPFGNLKTLHVSFCDVLKFLFFPSTARGLSQLEEMEIKYCHSMQSIIAYERGSEIKEDGHVGTNLQLFPKLRSLKLESLSQLINFSSELETASSTSLSTNASSEGSFFNHQVSFPKLEELELINLPKLKDIWHHQLPFGSSCNLQILRVYNCPCLVNLVPSHLTQSFKNLKEIDVQDCKLLEHVVILQGIDENVEIFPKLETLNLKDLPKLKWIEEGNDSMKYISSPVTLMNIQNLKELHITNCRMEDLQKM